MRSIAVVNQKGGCGKTTTTVNLAGALVTDGQRVLVVDMDPQAHSCMALGIDPDEHEKNLFDILAQPEPTIPLSEIIVPALDGLGVAPSSIILSSLEQKRAGNGGDIPLERLAHSLAEVSENYDYALIDCPPNVGLLTLSALRAAGEVIIPLEASFFAIDGVQKLIETIHALSERIRHEVSVRILPTLYDGRTRFARETLQEIRELFGERCFDTVIRQNVKLREAVRRGLPVTHFAPSTTGSIDYRSLALEVEAGAPIEIVVHAEPTSSVMPHSIEVELRFSDVGAADVRIAGDFNDWVPDKDVRSSIDTSGQVLVWTKTLQLGPGTYQYRYVVDGEWREDPTNPRSEPGPSGLLNSVLVVS